MKKEFYSSTKEQHLANQKCFLISFQNNNVEDDLPSPEEIQRIRYSPNTFIIDLPYYLERCISFNPNAWLTQYREHEYISDRRLAVPDKPHLGYLPMSRMMQIFDYKQITRERYVLKKEAIEISNWYFLW